MKTQNQKNTASQIMCSQTPSPFFFLEIAHQNIRSNCPSAWVPPLESRMDSSTAGEPPLAGVNLGPNHTHYLLLHLRLLGVDVGISYLAILIPAHIAF